MMNWFKTLFPPVPAPAPGEPFAPPGIARRAPGERAAGPRPGGVWGAGLPGAAGG
jgi:hypothetical protein